jgi:large subunit ribosomal protein L2
LIKSSNRNCLLALLKFSNGTFSYILASHGLKPGSIVFTAVRPQKFSSKYKLGCSVLIKYLELNTIFYNLEINPSKGGIYSRSAGTFCTIINIEPELNTAVVQLPTNKTKTILSTCSASLGRASNVEFNNQFFSKAGYYRNKGFRPKVRGVAMNPVDHPHGGRTKTSSPELTP